MGKKMKKLPFLSKINIESSSWPWPAYCHQPRTLSFRTGQTMFKTISSAYLDATNDHRNESCYFTNSSSDHCPSFSTTASEYDSGSGGGDCVEAVIQGLRSSERLFFEPGESNSILEEAKTGGGDDEDGFLLKESVVLSMESQDPYVDFKKSMEEMVEAHGLKDWEGLEELLCCYLRVNGKSNHGYIVGAFVELLVGIAFGNDSSDSSNTSLNCTSHCHHHHDHHHYSPSSPLSFCASTTNTTSCSDDSSSIPCVSSLELAEDDQEEIDTISPCFSSLQINDK